MKKFMVILVGIFFISGCMLLWQKFHFDDGKLHLIFCDVGQGDAILIITPDHKHILIDGGPDESVLTCLANHMPVWEKNIDLMILTHPHADHLIGMHFVLQRYNVEAFAIENLDNKTRIYHDLLQGIENKGIPKQTVWAEDSWVLERSNGEDIVLTVKAPTQDFIDQTSPGGTIGESGEFASLILELSYGSFSALLTGDSQAASVMSASDAAVDVLHVPHHGSGTGLNHEILDKLAPNMAVISVGKNRYGHPTPLTLSRLKEKQIPILRTDKNGDIEILTDGKSWVNTHYR